MPRSPASPARTCRCHTRPISKNSRCLRSRTWSQRQRRSVTGEEPMATFDALHVPPTALEHGGVEVLRAAIVEGGLHVSLRRAFDDPQAWGMLIADVARHAARIFAKETKLTEEEALERIRSKWLTKVGEKVKPGDVIAEIETDKATMEYEAIDEGTLAKIVVAEGTQDVPVKALIAVLAEEGEDVKAAAAGAGTGAPAAKAAPTAKPASAAPSPRVDEGVSARPSPPARSAPAGSDAAPARAAPQAPAASVSQPGEAEGMRVARTNRVFSSPLARRLAKEAGIDLARVEGSGPHGRVIARDVEAAKSGRGLA